MPGMNSISFFAQIATASLIRIIDEGKIDKDALIMLNITGGGEERFQLEKELHYLQASMVFDIDPDEDEVKEKLSRLF